MVHSAVWGLLFVVVLYSCQAVSAQNPTAVHQTNNDTVHLFAPIGNTYGRRTWTPTGWAPDWRRHPNNSGVTTDVWRGDLVVLSWYDGRTRPTGLVGGPRLEGFLGFYTGGSPRLAVPLLFTDLDGLQWIPSWTLHTPPVNVPGEVFLPQAGWVYYDGTNYHRAVFGRSIETNPTLGSRLREYHSDGTGLNWTDHGVPSSASFSPSNTSMGANSAVRNPQNGESWVFVTGDSYSSQPLNFLHGPEVFVRHRPPGGASWSWVSLGEPYAGGSASARTVRLSTPIAVGFPSANNFIVRMFVVVGKEHEPFSAVNEIVSWELWERRFNGSTWQSWTPLGTLPASQPRPLDDNTFNFVVTSAQVWSGLTEQHVSIFGMNRGKLVEIDCAGATCAAPVIHGTPPNNNAFYTNTSFAHDEANFDYLSVIGRTEGGQIWERYRDTRIAPGWEWRQLYAAAPTPNDLDGDGLANSSEDALANSDQDRYGCLDRLNPDSDNDQILDGEEQAYNTEPCSADTDGDQIIDGTEVAFACLDPVSGDALEDPDNDGLNNALEISQGTNPCSDDTDGDNVPDDQDNCQRLVNASQDDMDGDGLGDACDGDIDGDGCPNLRDPTPTDHQSQTAFCPFHVLDAALDEKGRIIIKRFEDTPLIAISEGFNPTGPRGPECLSCPPFEVTIVDRKTRRQLQSIKALQFGFDPEESTTVATRIIPDVDRDGVDDLVLGVPFARGGGNRAKAGVAVLVSGKSGKELNRIEGDKAGAFLGRDLGLRDEYTLVIGAPSRKKETGAVYFVNLADFGVKRILRDHVGDAAAPPASDDAKK